MDEEIELTTVDGQTVRVALSGAVRACGAAIQHGAYSVPGRDGESIEVRRVREDDAVPPEIEEDAAAVAVAVDAAVTRVLGRRAADLIKAIRAITVELPNDEPNGEAERQIDNLLAAIDHVKHWTDRDEAMRRRVARISEAGAKLVAALADDTKALRTAAEAYFGGDFSKPEAP